ncbi:MAG TPA: carboxy terminal-processing peptidase [Chitinophagaceae bacterium]|nr:carboxy terminal-processing peptidase [Chitinophagaceae bacterium]
MQNFIQFMKSKNGILVLIAFAFGVLFIAFTNTSLTGKDDTTLEQRKKLLAAIGLLLEKQHYSPKAINDQFSKQVFSKFLEELDGEKNFFLQSDIEELKKYETTIDNEIHGGDIAFSPAVGIIYDKRLAEITSLYKEILATPFNFSVDEVYQSNSEKISYCKSVEERRDRWYKKLKYLTLERYSDLIDQREKITNKDSIKADANIEIEARERVLKIMNRTFEKIKIAATDEKRFSSFVNVITNLMDPHSDYFPPVEKRAFDEQMSGRFYGIGAQLQETEGVIKIASLVAGYPAWRSGEIEANDIIVKVAQSKTGEAIDITGYEITEAVKLIRGNKGTEVTLTIKKQNGTTKIVTLMRDEIVQDESYVRSAVINENNKKIGYIYLPDFYADFERVDGARCSEDVAVEIRKLKAENIDGIVMDLRSNGGGSLYEVVQMVGLFIKTGPIVQVRDKEGKISVLSDNNPSVLYDGPLAVMVNGFSASASEIFAAAIQDYKRGIIVGTTTSTYGKGTVQRNVPLGNILDYNSGRTEFGAVKLTFQKFYRINGGSTQLKGVEPDILLPDSYEYLKFREKDNTLSLPWDEIKKADYQVSATESLLNTTITNAKSNIVNNEIVSIINSNALWLSKNSEQPISLNIVNFKEQQKLVKATVVQINSLVKLKEEMKVTVTKADNDKFYANPDKAKGERYQAWLKSIKSDFYIGTTTQIIGNMSKSMSSTANK